MKVKLGKTYPDGSQDLEFSGMDECMMETLLRLGMVKCIEDAVKQNADWLRQLGEQDEQVS